MGQSLLLATFSSLLTLSYSKRVLMMCGWERSLLKISLTDASLNLVASLVLVYRYGVLGVALGTMIPTVLIGWFWIVPLTAKYLKLGMVEMWTVFAKEVYLPVLSAVAMLTLLCWLAPVSNNSGFIACIWRGTVVMGILLVTGLPFLRSMRRH